MQKYSDIEQTHILMRMCNEKGCFNEGKAEETPRYTCWCCGSILTEVTSVKSK